MEWQNWDKLLENMSAPPPATPNATTLEKWMVVDIDNNAAIGVLRLEQVCNNLDIFDAIFLVICIVLCPMKSNIVFVAEGGLWAGIRAHRGPLVQVNEGGCG